MSLQTAKIEVTPFLPMKGIYYIGQYGTSGYACAARGYLYHYFQLGIPITWDPLYFEDTELEDDDPYNVVIKSLINKKISYDTVMIKSTPDLWPMFWKQKGHIIKNKIIIGKCTWETDILPKSWVNDINNCVHELWVPSNYNNVNFIKSGVKIKIRTVPYIFLSRGLLDRKLINLNKEDVYTFYTIGENNIRKNITESVESFCKAFSKADKVRLIVKTHSQGYTFENKKKCLSQIENITNAYPNHADIILLLEPMSMKQISSIHSIGDCYVSLTRSEGFGLPMFDAYNYGKQIICTGYSGHMDFIGHNHPGIVGYTLKQVHGLTQYLDENTKQSKWAYPNMDHAIELMRKTYKEHFKNE